MRTFTLLTGALVLSLSCASALPRSAFAQTSPANNAGQPVPNVPGDTMPASKAILPDGHAAPAGFTPIAPSLTQNLYAELKATGEFTILIKALDATNLSGLIQTHPDLTLLAPTDAAFDALPPGKLDDLLKPANAAALQHLLVYHLIAAKVAPSEVEGHAPGPIKTAAGAPVTFDGTNPVLKINDANVLQAGVAGSNGYIYVLDKVLTPPS
jgi:uncharacterized surface protein with fasciclin (FAS1) repeats